MKFEEIKRPNGAVCLNITSDTTERNAWMWTFPGWTGWIVYCANKENYRSDDGAFQLHNGRDTVMSKQVGIDAAIQFIETGCGNFMGVAA